LQGDGDLKFLAVGMFVVVAWLSLAPATVNYAPGAPTAPLVPLFARMATLFVLSTVVFLAWRANVRPALIVMAVSAIVFEVGQVYSTNRVFSVEDLAGNIIGVVLAFLFFRALWQFVHRLHV
jgi:glycopeptide antibiotics resistance protein